MQDVTLEISGMSCGHCVRAVDAALRAVPGVTVREVQVGSAALAVEGGGREDVLARAVQALGEAGYDATVAGAPAA